MPLHGALGQHQPAGDGPVGEPAGDQGGYLPLARGERIPRREGLSQLADQLLRTPSRAGHVEPAGFLGGLPACRAGGSASSDTLCPVQLDVTAPRVALAAAGGPVQLRTAAQFDRRAAGVTAGPASSSATSSP